MNKSIASDSDNFKKRCAMNTTEWEYTTARSYSFVTEFDLVCSKTSVAALATSAVYMGGMAGSSLAGLWGCKLRAFGILQVDSVKIENVVLRIRARYFSKSLVNLLIFIEMYIGFVDVHK